MTMKKDKIEGIIQKNVSEIIQFSLKDPKIGFITITDVSVTGDLSLATIYVSFLGQQARSEAGMKALERGKGYIRSELAKRMTIRKVPDLKFKIDVSLDKGNKIDAIIRKIQKD
ncbi:MAG: 30S ribosome-binding factor RbfA [Erysipelotrichaceae bacterium]